MNLEELRVRVGRLYNMLKDPQEGLSTWHEAVWSQLHDLAVFVREADAKTKKGEEFIICAAYWVNDGKQHPHQPVNTGYILAGWRHHNVLGVMNGLDLDREHLRGQHSGFLTSKGRFVGRKCAFDIAFHAGQLNKDFPESEVGYRELYSEDIY